MTVLVEEREVGGIVDGPLDQPADNLVVNLIGLPLADRPPFFLTLLPRLLEMRARTGRPHWIVVDEAHLSRPFLETLKAVEFYRADRWAETPVRTPFQTVFMSATVEGGMMVS